MSVYACVCLCVCVCVSECVRTRLSPLWAVWGMRMGPSSSAGLSSAPRWPSVKMVFLLFRDGLEKKLREAVKETHQCSLKPESHHSVALNQSHTTV